MIDTIGVQFVNIVIPYAIYSTWDVWGGKKGKYKWYGFTVSIVNGATFQFTYFPSINNGLLKVAFSLPHVVLGSNVCMLYDIKNAIDLANLVIPIVSGIPPLDLWKGVLYRLDVCYNHQVGNLAPYIVQALQFLDFHRRKRISYDLESVTFSNGQRKFKAYDKEKERLKEKDIVGALAARGILRQETVFSRRAITKLTGKKNPTLQDITIDMLLDILEDELQELGLLGRSIGTHETTIKILREKYGPKAGMYYFGLIKAKTIYPSNQLLADDMNIHPRSLEKQLQKIVDAGVPLTLTEHFEPLPPLTIDREMVWREVRKGLAPGNTGYYPQEHHEVIPCYAELQR
jgi:hypothetical protein